VPLISTAKFLATYTDSSAQFAYFKEIQNKIQLLTCSFSSDSEKAPDILHMKFGNFQSDKGQKKKFNSVKGASFFYCSAILNIF
jgi:hypothetical protein